MRLLEHRIPPIVVVAAIGTMMYALSPLLPSFDFGWAARGFFSLAIAGVGAWFVGAGVIEFLRNKTTVDPRQPDKASALVVSGIYKISRNPMYVGFALLLLALTVYLQSPLLVVGVVLFVLYMNRFQIAPEERAMITLFGDQYVRYQSRVRRWI